VEVRGDIYDFAVLLDYALEQHFYLGRIGIADGVADSQLIGPGFHEAPGQAQRRIRIHRALNGAAPGGGQPGAQARLRGSRMLVAGLDDTAKVVHRLCRGATYVGLIVTFTHRGDVVQLVHTGIEAAQRPFEIRRQRGHAQIRNLQGGRHHLQGIGELRDEFRRHEGAHLYFRHTAGGFRAHPGDLLRRREKGGNALQSIARAHLANLDVNSISHDESS